MSKLTAKLDRRINHKSPSTFFLGLLLAVVTLVSGCANRPQMAFQTNDEPPIHIDKAVLLMTVTLRNNYRTSFQPELFLINVDKPKARIASDRLTFGMDKMAYSSGPNPEAGRSYMLRIPVTPGPYQIQGIISRACGFVCGTFFAPLLLPVEVAGPGMFYLGHISATVRERQGDEFRAGPLLPLIDQAATGAWTGTFDVEVSDRFDTEEAMFRSRFAALERVEIKKAILPPFNRAASTKWWEVNGLASGFQLLPNR